ncbi:MAG: type II secretion system protein [Candidatus Omnitrophota bacterium]
MRHTTYDMRYTTYDNKGFTLIELLAAIVLIALALIPIMMITTQMIASSMKDEHLTKVIFLAERKIEMVKRELVNDFSVSKDETVTAFNAPYDDYKYTVSDDEGTGIKVIQIMVWYDEDGDNTLDSNEQVITFNTKVADRG